MNVNRSGAASSFLLTGIAHANKATAHDTAERYQEALSEYMIALEYLEKAQFYEPIQAKKDSIRTRMTEYVGRAEVLKTSLSGKNAAPPQGPSKPTPSKADAEADELTQSMSGIIMITKPDVKFSDIIGLDGAKAALHEALVDPVRFPTLYGNGVKPWRGILLFGPAGTGKTHLARAIATEVNYKFLCVSASDVYSKWLGESEKIMNAIFKLARQHAPSVIFIDEIDSLLGDNDSAGDSAGGSSSTESGRRVMTTFQENMDGIKPENGDNFFFLAATNHPWRMNEPVLRRFQKMIYISLPDADGRANMIEHQLRKATHTLTAPDYASIAARTDGYSCYDLTVVVNDVLHQPIRRYKEATHFLLNTATQKYTPSHPSIADAVPLRLYDLTDAQVESLPITMADFETVLPTSKKTTTPDKNRQYDIFRKKYEGGEPPSKPLPIDAAVGVGNGGINDGINDGINGGGDRGEESDRE